MISLPALLYLVLSFGSGTIVLDHGYRTLEACKAAGEYALEHRRPWNSFAEVRVDYTCVPGPGSWPEEPSE